METDTLNPVRATSRSHLDKDCPHVNLNSNPDDGSQLRWRPLILEEDEDTRSRFPWLKTIIFLLTVLTIVIVMIILLRKEK